MALPVAHPSNSLMGVYLKQSRFSRLNRVSTPVAPVRLLLKSFALRRCPRSVIKRSSAGYLFLQQFQPLRERIDIFCPRHADPL